MPKSTRTNQRQGRITSISNKVVEHFPPTLYTQDLPLLYLVNCDLEVCLKGSVDTMLDYESHVTISVYTIAKDCHNNVQYKNICLNYLNFVKFRTILQELLKKSNLDKLTL